MRKRWMAAVIGMVLAAPAADAANTPQQAAQSQAEHERGIYHVPPNHQDPAAEAARRMEGTEGHSHAPQPAPARR